MEYLDIVDVNNNLTGKSAERRHIHEKGIWHREVAIWIMNEHGDILLQKRAATKINKPNKWATCAGHIETGESVEHAMLRELEEELNFITIIDKLELMWIQKREDMPLNRFFQYMYFIKTNWKIEDYKIQLEELSELKYVSFEEFERIIDLQDSEVTFSKQSYAPRLVEELRKRI